MDTSITALDTKVTSLDGSVTEENSKIQKLIDDVVQKENASNEEMKKTLAKI